ncbi:MAG: sensor histidine kinase, partial [Eubacterium sp.]
DAYQMNFEMHDIGEIARAQAVQFASIYPSKTITVTGSDCFRLDSEWIAEAIGNVLKNACEHTAENGKIDIRVYGSEFENVTTVEIEDNGGGVPESELPKLFVRFYKSPNSSAESTGIGLALTRVIVEKHHGKISARNKTQGLCITMCFPHEIYNSAI